MSKELSQGVAALFCVFILKKLLLGVLLSFLLFEN